MTEIIDAFLPLAIAAFCIYRVQKKPSSWLKVLSVVLLLVGFNNVYRYYTKPASPAVGDRAHVLDQIAQASNRTLPRQLDDLVRLDRMSSTEDALVFHYTIIKASSITYTAKEFEETNKPDLISRVSSNPGFEQLRPLQPKFIHIFTNSDVGFESKITITPENYQKAEQVVAPNGP